MMSSIKLNGRLRAVANSAIIIFLGVLATVSELFPSLRNYMASLLFKWVGISSPIITDTVSVLVVGLPLFFLSYVVNSVIDRRHKRLLMTYQASLATVVSSNGSGDRIRDFQLLRSQARESILVMGIGMTYFSTDRSYLRELLDRGLSIRLLMMNPDIIVQDLSLSSTPDYTIINKELFDSVFVRPGYATDVRTSLERLCRFIEDRKIDEAREGRIELRVYPCLILMNVTIIDEHTNKNGQMLIEFCPPFSDNRMRVRISESSDKEMFHILLQGVEELWERSDVIANDYA